MHSFVTTCLSFCLISKTSPQTIGRIDVIREGNKESWLEPSSKAPDYWAYVTKASLAVIALTVVLRLPFLIDPGWSVDSYSNWTRWPDATLFMQQGRPGQYLMVQLFEAFGIDRNASAGLLQGLGVVLLAAAAPLLFLGSGRISERKSILALTLGGVLFTTHPFQAEILTFPEASFFASFASALGIAGIAIAAHRRALWWVGALLFAAALSVYQLVINYAAMMIVFGAVLALHDKHVSEPLSRALRGPLHGVLAFATGLVLYLASTSVASKLSGVARDGRAQLIGVDQIAERASQFHVALVDILRHPLIIDLPPAELLLALCVVAGWLMLVASCFRRSGVAGFVALASLPALVLASFGIVLAGANWWPVARVLGGTTLFMSMGLFALVIGMQQGLPRRLTASLGGIVIVSASLVGFRIHADQEQVNQHDRFLAKAIYQRLIEKPGFEESMPIALVNLRMRWTHPIGVKTVKGDMNISAFSTSWSPPGLFALATGRKLNFAAPAEDDSIRCEAAKPWPSTEAIILERGRAIVCL